MNVNNSNLLKFYDYLPSDLQNQIFLNVDSKYFDLWEQLYPFTFLDESSLLGQNFPERDYPQVIQFGQNFNQPIDQVKFPPSLVSLSFGYNFNQPIDQVKFPPSLQSLTFGVGFNQPIDQVTFPPSLQSLTFGDNFNQPIDKVKFPPFLKSLTFGNSFNQPIDQGQLPIFLENFTWGEYTDEAEELLNQVRARQEEIFELIQMFKSDSKKGLGKIQEINNLFQILSYRDSQDYTGKVGLKLLKMYQDWAKSH